MNQTFLNSQFQTGLNYELRTLPDGQQDYTRHPQTETINDLVTGGLRKRMGLDWVVELSLNLSKAERDIVMDGITDPEFTMIQRIKMKLELIRECYLWRIKRAKKQAEVDHELYIYYPDQGWYDMATFILCMED